MIGCFVYNVIMCLLCYININIYKFEIIIILSIYQSIKQKSHHPKIIHHILHLQILNLISHYKKLQKTITPHHSSLLLPLSTHMTKNKVKIQFFQHEIDYLLDFKQSIEQLNRFLKQALISPNQNEQVNAISLANQHIKQEIKIISENVVETKKLSDLMYDQAKIQEKLLFRSLDDKIQELGERLFVAQSWVQKAQIKKKQLDLLKNQYEMSNIKSYKKQNQVSTINKYLSAQKRVIKQYMRSLNLMIKINQRQKQKNSNKSQNGLHCNFINLLKMRQNKISYTQMRRNLSEMSEMRRCHSQQKSIHNKDEQFLHMTRPNYKKQPLLSMLIKSQNIPYRTQRQYSIHCLVRNLRQDNKKQTIINKKLKDALQNRNRDQVLKYLQSKQQLNQQQSIMKIQLMSSKLADKLDQRILSLKLVKKYTSKDFNEGDRSTKIYVRSVKSVQKLNCQASEMSEDTAHGRSHQKSGKKKLTVTQQNIYEKPFTSNPRTNDSLGHIA